MRLRGLRSSPLKWGGLGGERGGSCGNRSVRHLVTLYPWSQSREANPRHSSSPSLFSLGPCPASWCLPRLGWVFPPHLTSLQTLGQTCVMVCLLCDGRFQQIDLWRLTSTSTSEYHLPCNQHLRLLRSGPLFTPEVWCGFYTCLKFPMVTFHRLNSRICVWWYRCIGWNARTQKWVPVCLHIHPSCLRGSAPASVPSLGFSFLLAHSVLAHRRTLI